VSISLRKLSTFISSCLKKEETERSRSPHREEFLERLVSAFPTGKTAISDSFSIPESVSRRRWLAGVAAPVRRSLQFYPGAKTARRGAARRVAAGHRPFRIPTFVCAHICGTGSGCPYVAGACIRGWHQSATRGTGGRHSRKREWPETVAPRPRSAPVHAADSASPRDELD